MGDCTRWCQSTRRNSYVEVASFIYCHSDPVQTAPAQELCHWVNCTRDSRDSDILLLNALVQDYTDLQALTTGLRRSFATAGAGNLTTRRGVSHTYSLDLLQLDWAYFAKGNDINVLCMVRPWFTVYRVVVQNALSSSAPYSAELLSAHW